MYPLQDEAPATQPPAVLPAAVTGGEERIVPVAATETGPAVPPYATAPAPATGYVPLQPPTAVNPPQANCPTCQAAAPPPSRGLLNLFRRSSSQEPPRLPVGTPPMTCSGPGCTSAVMLRPVPSEGTFTAAQRVPAPESQQVLFVPAARPADGAGELPPVDTGKATTTTAAPPPAEMLGFPKGEGKDKGKGKGKEKDKGGAAEILPPPRVVKPKPEGYPDLPAPTVTQPPAAPREFAKRALSDYIIEPPDVLQIDLSPVVGDRNFPVRGTHLVRPDGTIGLGPYGAVFVAGLTIEQAKFRVADRITKALFEEDQYYAKFRQVMQALKLDVTAYNSKYYYLIADGGGYGEQVYRILCTGNETVLDAIAQVEGLPRVASKSKIWVARATPTEVHQPHILPVDWVAITQLGSAATNYQIYPGDRIFVNSDPLIRFDSFLAKVISPIERLFGVTLLGSTTVNSIKNGTNNGGGGFGR
jgi:polysaccharide export outer membrane protein